MEIKKRLLGIDYGPRRLGLAVSDAFHLTARPLKAIDLKITPDLFNRLQIIIAENEIEEIVLGLPLHMNDSESEISDRVRVFAAQLRQTIDLPIHLEDERLSSSEAKSMLYESGQWKSVKKDKSKIDSMAAVVILKSFMSR